VKTDELSVMENRIRALRHELETLNSEINVLIKERDLRNEKFSEFIKEAQENKTLRDEINDQIKEDVALRKEALSEIRKLNKRLNALRKKRNDINQYLEKNNLELRNPGAIQKEMEQLEWKLETSVLSLDKENKLVELIRQKKNLMEPCQNMDTIRKEMKEIFRAKDKIKEKLNQYSEKINEVQQESQKYHERMLYAYKRANEIKADADSYHQQFVKKKEERDKVYKDYKELLDRKNEIVNKIQEDKIKKEVEAIKKRDKLMKTKAEKIYDDFMKGKRLNTEEFRILQEGGLLE
jgi:uncharacterized coiled-coil DUF342 family protein